MTSTPIRRLLAIALPGTAAVLALTITTATPAAAGPVNSADAQAVINDLQSKGYRVIVTKNGSGRLSECSVSSVTQQSLSGNVQSSRNMRNQPTTVPSARRNIAYVALSC